MTYLGTNINQLPTPLPPPDPRCDCGRLKEPSDFLRWRCWRDIKLIYAAKQTNSENEYEQAKNCDCHEWGYAPGWQCPACDASDRRLRT